MAEYAAQAQGLSTRDFLDSQHKLLFVVVITILSLPYHGSQTFSQRDLAKT
jgi:hypothetical protein